MCALCGWQAQHFCRLPLDHLQSASCWLQDSRLNYVEQHAERIGLDSDKLDSLRVNASKASPMGDTLDLCARYADGNTLDEMVSQHCLLCLWCISARKPVFVKGIVTAK